MAHTLDWGIHVGFVHSSGWGVGSSGLEQRAGSQDSWALPPALRGEWGLVDRAESGPLGSIPSSGKEWGLWLEQGGSGLLALGREWDVGI